MIANSARWTDFVVDVLVGVFNARASVQMVGAIGEAPTRPWPCAGYPGGAGRDDWNSRPRERDRLHPREPAELGWDQDRLERPGAKDNARPRRCRLWIALGRQGDTSGAGSVLRATISRTWGSDDREILFRTRAQTVQPLTTLDAEMALQVAKLDQESGVRVDIVAESEGALVVTTYLVSHHDPPVSTVVLASPLLEPGRVSYPAGTSSAGFGLASRYAMQLLGTTYQSVAPIDLSPQSGVLEVCRRVRPAASTSTLLSDTRCSPLRPSTSG